MCIKTAIKKLITINTIKEINRLTALNTTHQIMEAVAQSFSQNSYYCNFQFIV